MSTRGFVNLLIGGKILLTRFFYGFKPTIFIGGLVEDSSPRRFFNFIFSSWSPMGGSREAGDGGWGMVLLVELGVAEILGSLLVMLGVECS